MERTRFVPGARRGLPAYTALLTAALSACSGGEDLTSIEADTELTAAGEFALDGVSIIDPSCNIDTSGDPCGTGSTCFRDSLTSAAQIAAQQLSSLALLQCLNEYYLTATNGDFPERMIAKMQSGTPTNIFCEDFSEDDDGTDDALAKAQVGISTEEVTFNTRWWLGQTGTNPPLPQFLAATLLHEVAHNKGYNHGLGSFLGAHGRSAWYNGTVNNAFGECSRSISTGLGATRMSSISDYQTGPGNVPDAGTVRRGGLARATLLSPAGRLGNVSPITTQTVQCGSGLFARGLRGKSGSFVDQLGMTCANSSGTAGADSSTTAGGTGGNPFTLNCGANELMVGLRATANNRLYYVRPACQAASLVQTSSTSGRALRAGGGTGDSGQGFAVYRWCPRGKAVKRIHANVGAFSSSSAVNGIRLECEDVDFGSIPTITPLNLRGTATTSTRVYREQCPVGSILTRIGGRAGAEIDRLEGGCSEAIPNENEDDLTVEPPNFHFQGFGGFGGAYGSDLAPSACNVGSSPVGIEVRTGSGTGIVNVNGLCADRSDWINASGSVPTTSMGWFGPGTAGSVQRDLCPRGTFIGGWDIGAGFTEAFQTDTVHTLRLRCVNPFD